MTFHAAHTNGPDAARAVLVERLQLDTPAADLDDMARELARIGNTPYAMVNIFGPDEQHFVGLHEPDTARTGLPAAGRSMPRDWGYCPEVHDRRKVFVLPDVYQHALLATNPVVEHMGIRTYAGAPLIVPAKWSNLGEVVVLGTVCWIGPEPREVTEASRDDVVAIKSFRDKTLAYLFTRAGLRPPQ